MNHVKIIKIRKQQGLTQEELAYKAGVTVRTIQRIENHEGSPRSYTIKAIAAALNISFEDLQKSDVPSLPDVDDEEYKIHFLKLLVVSCFSYLLVPFLHFLIPAYLLQKRSDMDRLTLHFARKLLRNQIYWVISLILAMLLTVSWNLASKHYFHVLPMISYLITLFVMYLINAGIIVSAFLRLKRPNLIS